MSTLRAHFDLELKTLTDKIISMSTLIEKAIDQTLLALVNKDESLAKQVIAGDDVFDRMEKEIEDECVSLISRQQPVASDLRAIFSIMKIVTDFERIADHCEDISSITLNLITQDYVKPLVDIPKMADLVKEMVRKTVDCYIEQDVIKARLICANDDAVDRYYQLVIDDVKLLLAEKPEAAGQLLDFLMIAKYLERMADHSTNIAEWVIYSVEGEHFSSN
ncbi:MULTISPECIES: phosphate signaling complex protein PhoU [unclassified Fusibacter]|uniref:phosphate signaling complex protein PhoU n=1 Tax=unclassified Fusibacter TaxID=2624464 RepID=UPI001011E4A2|nr:MULTISPECIES: phosphate signaling complex protein PhoU [unclassified Fusibacter]MCK8061298.1 phosphate signaling complex protein PhoU [Fusibacter sp. A2]NPE23505.1 phosphate signaling complex protein PhoU [Fusibacter sp. A1]RXV59110.1 phosphate transport system regulatory protein PhoU [Fusibacter sp. A1]